MYACIEDNRVVPGRLADAALVVDGQQRPRLLRGGGSVVSADKEEGSKQERPHG